LAVLTKICQNNTLVCGFVATHGSKINGS